MGSNAWPRHRNDGRRTRDGCPCSEQSHDVGVAVAAALSVALTGCGAGQQAQTSNQVPASGGAAGSVDTIQVRDAHFMWNGPVPAGSVYQPGEDAPLQVTIVNNATNIADDG